MPRSGKSITMYSKYCILKEEYMSTISQYYLGEKNTSHGCITLEAPRYRLGKRREGGEYPYAALPCVIEGKEGEADSWC